MCSAQTPLEMPAIWNNDSTRAFACKFWEGQTRLLDNMQQFASGWFERRHVGTRAALEAAQKACEARNPADTFACYQEWAAGAASRILDDQLAYQQLVHAAVSSMASAQPELADVNMPAPLRAPRAA
ncbi:MAG: hypothetical protein J0G28_15450 [Afipia sp.]|nr:hypothetical protein [Afipia sp.]OJW65664.1 MAG: hypothetical protein BGO65_13280 [Afipia sp. 64-13]